MTGMFPYPTFRYRFRFNSASTPTRLTIKIFLKVLCAYVLFQDLGKIC